MLGTYQERMDALKELYPTWTPRTFWTQFVFTQERFPHQPFLIYNNQIYDYEQVRSRADKLARSLISTGVRPKEHVALLMRNCPEAIELSLAMAKIGAIRIPVHAKSGPEELKRVLLLSNSTVLITERSLPEEVLDG